MKKFDWKARLRYKFDNTLSKGSGALIGWLGIITLILVIVAIGIILVAQSVPQGNTPIDIAWDVLYQALTPNPVDPTSFPPLFMSACRM